VTDQLKLYNDALLMCGERQLDSTNGLTEDTPSRYWLDSVWDNGAVNACLEEGQWRFAMRTIALDYTDTVTPTFGLNRAFIKPSDWVATSSICSDEYFRNPLLGGELVDESGYWYAGIDVLYVRYVSNDENYGTNYTAWPVWFADFVAAHLAFKIANKFTADEEKRKDIKADRKHFLMMAKNKNAEADPTQFPPPGTWSSARIGRSRKDRGNRGQLIG